MDVAIASPAAVDWVALDELLRNAYAFMDGRIDPPSSLHTMTLKDLRQKAEDEILLTATISNTLVGCLFCRPAAPWLYVGKMAVAVGRQGSGIGAALMARARAVADELGLIGLELETRIELTENHRSFERMGFHTVAERAHEGFDRPTEILMRSPNAPSEPSV